MDFTDETYASAVAENKVANEVLEKLKKFTKGKGVNEGVDYSAILANAEKDLAAITDFATAKDEINKLLFKYRLEISFTFDKHIMSGLIQNINRKEFYDSIRGKKSHRIIFGIRPEDIYQTDVASGKDSFGPSLSLNVTLPELVGNEYYVHTKFQEKDLVAKVPAGNQIAIGDKVSLAFDLSKAHLFDTVSTLLIK